MNIRDVLRRSLWKKQFRNLLTICIKRKKQTNNKNKYISKTPSINDYIQRKKAKEYENLNNKINEINNFINNMK